jgi:hypothetical protein
MTDRLLEQVAHEKKAGNGEGIGKNVLLRTVILHKFI